MSVADYNEQHLAKLAEAARFKGLAVLVGAGSSIACGYPGWDQFLSALEKPLEHILRDEHLEELRQRDARTRLDRMAAYLADEYQRIFEETFKPLDGAKHPPEWIRLIYDLPLRLLLTTNYTVEIEQASQFTNVEAVRWYDSKAVARALKSADGRTRLIYLHGRYDDRVMVESDPHGLAWSRVILGEKSYRYAYEHPGMIAIRLSAVCQTHTLLVLAASLEDEDITGLLRAVGALDGDIHYAVLVLPEDKTPESVAEEYRERFGLQPIFYEVVDNDHDTPLTALMHDLVERTNAPWPPSIDPKSDPPLPEAATPGEFPPRPRVVHPLLRAAYFEPRPLHRSAIDDFLVAEQGGILALVGMGGAGKTALVREALDPILRGKSLVRPAGLFVWSFYDDPSPVAFFGHLAHYLTGKNPPDGTKEAKAYELARGGIRADATLLFVLDGLERLQTEQHQPGRIHGNLENTILRIFLLWLAQAPVHARALITTRFPLPDLETEEGGDRVRLIDVDTLTRPQARSLLRRHGVHGSDPELNAVLDHFGTHALTVDHLGGVLANYLGGDARRFRELGHEELTRFEVGQTTAKLARVLAAYEGYLARDEPEVRDALRRVAIFPRAIGAETLVAGLNAQTDAAAHKQLELRRRLRRLVSLRLLREERQGTQEVYSIHPAVREAVLLGMGDTRFEFVQAARKALEAGLEKRPGFDPRDKETLTFIEQLIFLCIDEGRLVQALDLYRERLGAYRNLGWRLGEYACGERICRRLLEATGHSEPLLRSAVYLLQADLALNLENLGRLKESLVYFRETLDYAAALAENPHLKVRLHNVSQAFLVAGQFPEAARLAEQALDYAMTTRDAEEEIGSLSWQALAWFELGRIDEAIERFRRCRTVQNRIEGNKRCLYSTRGFNFQIALLQCGRTQEALSQAEAANTIHRGQGWLDSIARCELTAAEAMRQSKRYGEARESLSNAREFAVTTQHQELLLYAHLFGSRLARDQDDLRNAREEAEEGLRIADTCGFDLFRVHFRNLLAELLLRERKPKEALDVAASALALSDSRECDSFWGRLESHATLASIHKSLGDSGAALQHSRSAEALRARIHLTDEMLSPLLNL